MPRRKADRIDRKDKESSGYRESAERMKKEAGSKAAPAKGHEPSLLGLAGFETRWTVACDTEEYSRIKDTEDRRLYLYGMIESVDMDWCSYGCASMVSKIVELIMAFNRADQGIPTDKRKPIRLYINSPGGELTEGFALISAIESSKTPVWTINVGQWCSMAFLIGIAGHKRFSLPHMTFLMHEGTSGAYGAATKVKEQIDFERRFEEEVVKKHVLAHGTMSEEYYDSLERVEFFMLPEDALKHGFIDEIVIDIDDIL